ncbi:MAG: TfoX/Sxy family protein [Planctomycetaceae bacterium]|nr:TfoX/Sxy family protein [Planctomycetales bacterium]MCB9873650.1 TfoX/Sxy family protein [Planctomycetaceae bacterium]MCB9940201.1 TfoX/Sxy family protein [Planctomycetaceae bacterium]
MTSPFIKYLLDMLSDLGDVRSRAMFGGHGIYHDGIMIGLIADGVFYLKVDDENRTAFEAEGSKPFRYRRKGRTKDVAMSYWEVPVDVLESREALCEWARDAHAAAVRSKAKKGKRK